VSEPALGMSRSTIYLGMIFPHYCFKLKKNGLLKRNQRLRFKKIVQHSFFTLF
jgi:hypothetical protein